MNNIYEDIHPEIPTEEFEELLVELREVIDEDYCFKNGIDYDSSIYASPSEILHIAIDFIKKTQEKEKE